MWIPLVSAASRTPVLMSVLLIIETSCPVPLSPRFGSSSVRRIPAINFALLFLVTVVISSLLITSLLITGVNP